MDHPYLKDKELFAHEELQLGGNSIRLITVYPDANEYNYVKCDIKQYAIHRRPGYIALSYMWGPPEDIQHPILIDDKVFWVRNNLYLFLIQLRKQHHEPITLWIDSLCIDQTNIPERTHIVQLMDQVYERSDQVYVWLGPGDEYSDRAMLFLKEVAPHVTGKDGLDILLERYILPTAHNPDWKAVVLLLSVKYWSRLWIIQETLLAPSIELFCGDHRLPWQHLQRVVLLIESGFDHYARRRPEKSILHAAITNTLAAQMVLNRENTKRVGSDRKSYPSLQVRLEHFKRSQCFEARDGIFGLLSIAGDYYDKRVEFIDYDLRSTQVFIKFLRHYLSSLKQYKDDQTMYDIRRLSDALRLDVYSTILPPKPNDTEAPLSHSDLSVNDKDLKLTMPCRILLTFVDSAENSNVSTLCCVLREYFGSTDSVVTPISPVAAPFSPSFSGSSDELGKLRRLARTKGAQICNAWSASTPQPLCQAPNRKSATFKYFTRLARQNDCHQRPCFGVTCSDSRPGDLLVKWSDSDLAFVVRMSGDGSYDVVGTAMMYEEVDIPSTLTSSIRKWWHSHDPRLPHLAASPDQRRRSFINKTKHVEESESQSVRAAAEEEPIDVRFNPLMLLMIVNDPNWRKDRLEEAQQNFLLKPISRQPVLYTPIQPRDEDDPVLKSFGAKNLTGHSHLDRSANRLLDLTASKVEEMKERAHYYDED